MRLHVCCRDLQDGDHLGATAAAVTLAAAATAAAGLHQDLLDCYAGMVCAGHLQRQPVQLGRH